SWLRRPSRLRLSKDAGLGSSASAGGRGGDGGSGGSGADAYGARTRVGSSIGSRASSTSGNSDLIAGGLLCSGEDGSAVAASGSGGGGIGSGGEPALEVDAVKEVEEYAEQVLASGASMGMGAEVSTQSNAPWESTPTAGQLVAASTAATAAAAGIVLPHLDPAAYPSVALAMLANDSDDARQYYM
ncbi:hypothetical protein Vretimale_9903, partial [Volvox reticuliferus]